MPNDYQCPRCKSGRVEVRYPDITCLSCQFSEPLIDYPIAYGQHRALMVEAGRPDPGPDYPPETTEATTPAPLDHPEIRRRFDDLQAQVSRLRQPELKQKDYRKPAPDYRKPGKFEGVEL